MSNCQDNRPTFLPEAVWKALMNLPALRYMKAPVDTVAQLYEKYPIGNEKGTFTFVHDKNTFYTYHPRGWHRGEWKPISADSVSSFFEIDAEFLKEGDILLYDNIKKKFVVKSGNVWNKLIGNLKDTFSQVTKFLNQAEDIPTDESDSGVYFVHKDNNDVEFRALYIVLGKKAVKIFNSSDWFTKTEVTQKIDDANEYVDGQVLFLETKINNLENIGVLKTYATYDLMHADVNSPIGDNKEPILNGQLVSVNNTDDTSKNGVYSYTINGNIKSWVFRSSFAIPSDMAKTGNSTLTMQQMDDKKANMSIYLSIGYFTPEKEAANAYVKSDNTITTYPYPSSYTKYFPVEVGNTIIYKGTYGQQAVGIIFLDADGNVVGYTSKATVEYVEEEVPVPNGAVEARANNLNDAIPLSVSYKDNIRSEINKNSSDITVNTNYIKDINDVLRIERENTFGEFTGLGNTNANYSYISKRVYDVDFNVKNISLKIGNKTDVSADRDIWIYTLKNNVITKVIGKKTITPGAIGNIININVDFVLNAGDKIMLALGEGLGITYNGSAGSSTYGFDAYNQITDEFEVGDILNPLQNFPTNAIGFGWGGIVKDYVNMNDYAKKTDMPTDINYLKGKKIVASGDSMVKGHSLADNQTWLYKLAIRNNMPYVNYGINGNRLTNTGGTGTPLVIRYTEMDNDADYVLIFICTNDAAAGVDIGNDTDTVDTTVKGALNILCDGLITKYPNKKIGFISPYLRNANYPAYVDAIKTICAKYSIPVFDNIINGGVCWSNAAQLAAISLNDTYHLNNAGMEYVSYKYEDFIRSL